MAGPPIAADQNDPVLISTTIVIIAAIGTAMTSQPCQVWGWNPAPNLFGANHDLRVLPIDSPASLD